jgi:ATP-dependent RNA helicase DeaD
MADKVMPRDLARASHTLGYAETPELVEELASAVDRGHHIAMIAAEGSGSELLFGLAAAGVVADDEEGLQALVLTATPERAARCARAAKAMGASRDLEVLVWPSRSDAEPSVDLFAAQAVTGRPERVLAAVRAGRLGLGALRLLVIDDVVALEGAWPVVETLLDTCAPDTQKIACAHAAHARLDDLIDRQLPRARRWPAELFPGPGTEVAGPTRNGPIVLYALAAGEEAGLHRLGEALHEVARSSPLEQAVIRCLTEEDALRVAPSLAAEGFRISTGAQDTGVRVGVKTLAPGEEGGVAVMFGLPARADVLRTVLEKATVRLAVVESRHAAQLELMIQRLGWRLKPVGTKLSDARTDDLHRFRDEVRSEIGSADLGGPLLLLEPLLEEFGAEPVAAALASMLRRGRTPAGEAGEAGDTATTPPEAGVERVMRRAWTRVFMGVGKRDGAGPGDLVGAITGETGTQAAQIGLIEVRGSYSLVDLDSQVADEVVRKLHGIRIKGRDVTVRLDRGR